MCGIVGVITKATNGFTQPQQDIFEEMLICDAVRGMDSTGIFSVNNVGNAQLHKIASHPFNLVKSNEYRAWKQDNWSMGKMVVGHNRKATVGAINNENAHPFNFGSVVMVHNGYIENYRSLVHHKEREKLKIEVDSAALALLLSREDPLKIIPELHGAFTIVWYNAAEKNLYLVRNTERPLAMVEGSEGSYYSSEKGLLRWMLKRRSMKGDIAELKPGVLLSINIDGKSEVKEVKLYEKAVTITQPHSPVHYHNPSQGPRRRHEPLVIDNDGVIHLPTQRPDQRYEPKKITMELSDSFNIHYGADKEIELSKELKWPQIVFSVDDFKMISEAHVEPPVWKMWGPALDSKLTEVACQFRGSEKEVEALAYATHLCAHITRVNDRSFGGTMGQHVACMVPRAVNIVATPNGLPIIDEHLKYLTNSCKCACGHVDYNTTEPGHTIFTRDGFQTVYVCRWCVEGTESCQALCEKPGQCDYCVNALKEREKPKPS